MNKVPPSPVITSRVATLLDIIGPDVYNIIEDYKESIERYEQNFVDIDECFENRNTLKTYQMTLNLEDFKDYCLEKDYNFHVEFIIKINGNESKVTYPLNVLRKTCLRYLNISTIRFIKKYSQNPWLEISLGDHKSEDIDITEKIIYDALFKYETKNHYTHTIQMMLDTDYMEDFFKNYIRCEENIISLI